MSDSITLGGRTFALRPLKLGQVRHLLDALDEMSRQSGGALVAAAAKVVAAGLAPAHPDLTADALLDLEAGVDELNAAVATVLRAAGLRPAAESAPGEAGSPGGRPPPAAAPGMVETAPAPSSAPSTPPSPPAAAGGSATSTN